MEDGAVPASYEDESGKEEAYGPESQQYDYSASGYYEQEADGAAVGSTYAAYEDSAVQAAQDSYVYTSAPAYFGGQAWPWVTPTAGTKTATLPAKYRWEQTDWNNLSLFGPGGGQALGTVEVVEQQPAAAVLLAACAASGPAPVTSVL